MGRNDEAEKLLREILRDYPAMADAPTLWASSSRRGIAIQRP